MSTFIGLPNEPKTSSRVLKPPGGGHSNIFAPKGEAPCRARPKYDQQNSSNVSGALGTTDANEVAVKTNLQHKKSDNGPFAPSAPEEPKIAAAPAAAVEQLESPKEEIRSSQGAPPAMQQQAPQAPNTRGRVPPGGFSSGFW